MHCIFQTTDARVKEYCNGNLVTSHGACDDDSSDFKCMNNIKIHSSGIQERAHENVLAGEATLRQSLLVMVAQDRVHRAAVGFYAVRPPVVAHQCTVPRNQI